MSFLKLIIFLFCFSLFSECANATNCEPATSAENHFDQWSAIHSDFELQASNITMTLGGNIPDWTILYTAEANIGMSASTCDGDHNLYYTLLSSAQAVGQQGNDVIYSTDVPGVGISIEATAVSNGAVKVYPSVVYYTRGDVGYGFWARIKFWKIPGEIPMNKGPITVTGPDAAIVYMNNGANFTSSAPDRITNDGKAYISSSRILKLTMMFQPGTCNVEGDNVKVNMGDYGGAGSHSDWKDASFKLVCPDGMGYNGSASSSDPYDNPYSLSPNASTTANNKKNGRVVISIAPYTEVIDANKGIIALDGTGAQGYGIQLAWGDFSSQNDVEPVNPVVLNSYVDANSLNSSFGAGDTPIGGNAFSGTDNTIKMAARYIRTTGETAPGPANAVVQVIANYE
ncbi:fimbrial protein [Lelliottia amnigena]|uniref:fimbrial protein n=1 Tax=Lelliottia amnigena TaxID=61646 RepID=UPI00192C9123|nr:fimbrial protein [Lelliottia amnigena]MBL5928844.1 fimbrial protein [Lelliottia amnigena]